MSSITLGAFLALAAQCAPSVDPSTLGAIAHTESALDFLVIGVNGAVGGPIRSATTAEAVSKATALVTAGHSVDLGGMQINSANLHRLGLTVPEVFNPCTNIAAGARILREGYANASRSEPDPQRALASAVSAYNTGSLVRGLAVSAGGNGYLTKVQASANYVVPEIRLQGASASPAPIVRAPDLMDDDPDAPPEWDVWARATYARRPGVGATEVLVAPELAVPLTAPAAQGAAAAVAPEAPTPTRTE